MDITNIRELKGSDLVLEKKEYRGIDKDKTLGDLIDEYMAKDFPNTTGTTRSSNLEALTSSLRNLNGALLVSSDGKIDINLSVYADCIVDLYAKHKQGTASRYTSCMKRFIRWMLRMGYIASDPHDRLRRVRSRKSINPSTLVITIDEYEALKLDTQGTKLYWAIVTAWNTGMSSIDCCLLRWDEIDMDNLWVRRSRQKTGTLASIPILRGSDFHEGLKILLEDKSNETPNDPEKNIYYVHTPLARWGVKRLNGNFGSLSICFRRAANRCGISDKKSFHGLRAQMCSLLENGGVGPAIACSITGHRDASIFKQYVTVDEDSVREQLYNARVNSHQKWLQRKAKKEEGSSNNIISGPWMTVGSGVSFFKKTVFWRYGKEDELQHATRTDAPKVNRAYCGEWYPYKGWLDADENCPLPRCSHCEEAIANQMEHGGCGEELA